MGRLWLCGICQNNDKDLEDILKPLGYLLESKELFAFWIDGGSSDNTIETILSFDGVVKSRKWTNDHDFQQNEYLRDPRIQHGDWIIQCDTSERIHPDFVHLLLDEMLDNFENQGIKTVYQRSKPVLFQKHDDQIFLGSPHWGLQNQRRHIVDIAKFKGFEEDKTYFWSNRDDINKWITNGMKYYYVYGRSNHMWLVYSPSNYPESSQLLIRDHEAKRLEFRDYCRNNLGLSMVNLDGITEYLKKPEGFTDKFVEFLKYEKVLANYFRYVNGEDQQTIYDTQNTWKYEEYSN